MTKGKVHQSTEESLTGHTLLKSISFKGTFRAQIYTCKMWVVWGRLPVEVISFNKAIKHSSSIIWAITTMYILLSSTRKRKSIHVGHCLFVKIICKPMRFLAACLHSTACINTRNNLTLFTRLLTFASNKKILLASLACRLWMNFKPWSSERSLYTVYKLVITWKEKQYLHPEVSQYHQSYQYPMI